MTEEYDTEQPMNNLGETIYDMAATSTTAEMGCFYEGEKSNFIPN